MAFKIEVRNQMNHAILEYQWATEPTNDQIDAVVHEAFMFRAAGMVAGGIRTLRDQDAAVSAKLVNGMEVRRIK